MRTVADLGPRLGVAPTCAALGVARASFYRQQRPQSERRPRPAPSRALTPADRQAVLDALHEPRFVDLAPAEVYATLLDEGRYLGSERTFYRVLAANAEVRERRDHLRHPRYGAPELLATRPNQLWSWDITRLLGPTKWTSYYRYVLLDVFSRYVVGWTVALCEHGGIAEQLIAESCAHQRIAPGQLTVHSDCGPAMISKPVALLLAVWINPPKGAAGAGVTDTTSAGWTQDSDPLEIVALRASHEADPGTDRLASQILTPEEPCMAAAQ